MKRVLSAIILLAAGLSPVPSFAETKDLGGTSWYSTNETCEVEELEFAHDGTVKIYVFLEDEAETGRWWLTGDELVIDYDNSYGGIEGTVFDDGIEAVDTWKKESSNTIYHDPCMFEPD